MLVSHLCCYLKELLNQRFFVEQVSILNAILSSERRESFTLHICIWYVQYSRSNRQKHLQRPLLYGIKSLI